MKKTMLVMLMLFSVVTFSQEFYVNAGFDLANAMTGSQPTNYQPKLDYKVRFIAQSDHVEVTAQFEHFDYIGFKSYFTGVNYVFKKDYYLINKERIVTKPTINYVLGVEAGIINRSGAGFFGYGTNSEIRVIFNHIGIGLQGNYTYRPEYDVWRFNGFVNLFYKL